MDYESLLLCLKKRDLVESRFSELFQDIKAGEAATDRILEDSQVINLLDNLKTDLKSKDQHIDRLQERIGIMNKHIEKLNDELISTNIENNIVQEKYKNLNQEHNKLVQRWLQKVQSEADAMNARMDKSNNSR